MKELRQEFQFNGEQCMHKNDKPRGGVENFKKRAVLDFFISTEFSNIILELRKLRLKFGEHILKSDFLKTQVLLGMTWLM